MGAGGRGSSTAMGRGVTGFSSVFTKRVDGRGVVPCREASCGEGDGEEGSGWAGEDKIMGVEALGATGESDNRGSGKGSSEENKMQRKLLYSSLT